MIFGVLLSLSSTAAVVTVDVPLLVRGSSWSYTVDVPGPTWILPSYNRALHAWQTGTAPFGANNATTTTLPATTNAVFFLQTILFPGGRLLSGSYLAINIAVYPSADVFFNGVSLDNAGALNRTNSNFQYWNRQYSVPLSAVGASNVLAVHVYNPQALAWGFDAEVGVQFSRLGDTALLPRNSPWQYSFVAPMASDNWTAVPAPDSWTIGNAPFGASANVLYSFNTPIALNVAATVWLSATVAVTAMQMSNAAYCLFGVAVESGADVYFNGIQLLTYNGSDDGGFLFWNNVFTISSSAVIVDGVNILAVKLSNAPTSSTLYFDAEFSIVAQRLADQPLVLRGSAWQWSSVMPNDASWTTAVSVTANWSVAQAPFGFDANPGQRFNTPTDSTVPWFWFVNSFVVLSTDITNAVQIQIGVASDQGADIWFNGVQIDNQAALGIDDGGYEYWNRVLTVPLSMVIVGTNTIAARLDNNHQPTDGTCFDAEVCISKQLLGSLVLVPRHSTWQWSSTTPSDNSWLSNAASATQSWQVSPAPFGFDANPSQRFNTPTDSTVPWFWFVKSFAVSSSNLASAAQLLVGVASDQGADIWFNGVQIDNQAALGSDDGGYEYWNRVLTVPLSMVIVGTNVIAARLDNNHQPTDGTYFDAEVALSSTTATTATTTNTATSTSGFGNTTASVASLTTIATTTTTRTDAVAGAMTTASSDNRGLVAAVVVLAILLAITLALLAFVIFRLKRRPMRVINS
jgi:hypothetical protein